MSLAHTTSFGSLPIDILVSIAQLSGNIASVGKVCACLRRGGQRGRQGCRERRPLASITSVRASCFCHGPVPTLLFLFLSPLPPPLLPACNAD